MSGRYDSEDRALARAEQLKHSGTWPATVRHEDGSFSLTYDPQESAS